MEIILDCDLMKFPNSGLYYYCLYLGNHVQNQLVSMGNIKMGYYIPNEGAKVFQHKENCITEKKYHRFFKPFMWNCRVWHAPFQSGRIVPVKRKYRNV